MVCIVMYVIWLNISQWSREAGIDVVLQRCCNWAHWQSDETQSDSYSYQPTMLPSLPYSLSHVLPIVREQKGFPSCVSGDLDCYCTGSLPALLVTELLKSLGTISWRGGYPSWFLKFLCGFRVWKQPYPGPLSALQGSLAVQRKWWASEWDSVL